ncbi:MULTISPECIES: NAD(P)H-hydrate dehydratase [Anaerotruncus]|uniref:NAD(P)H-hydrate dehydratase n=1 Tax=Anaerotruncus TaxID=244127 RepID=UPI000C78DB01|nr:NAD(P)H-hydrate dehydratase [Anaerotruncus massiliensis (ex Togo et al. 2019)]
MRILTSEQMKTVERNSLNYSMSCERLMENAGSAAAAAIRRAADVEGRYVTIFCGRGNNGGDGFVAARRLSEAGANVAVVLTDGDPKTPEAAEMLRRIGVMDIAVVGYGDDPEYLTERLASTDLLVDAIYGTGFHGELDGRHRDVCRLINGVGVRVFALDIPSGVNADTGEADPCAVRAGMTVVFDSDKPATAMPAAAEYCGEVVVADIGIPPEAHEGVEPLFTLVDRGWVFDRLPRRRRDTHKGDYGKLLNVAGSQRYMGAAVLSTLAAMRSGAGYVTLASTKEVCRTVLPMLPEAVLLPLAQNPDGSLSYKAMDALLEAAERSTAVLVGNGLGTGPDACRIVYELVRRVSRPLVIDADGINALARNIDILKDKKAEVILTPHLMELSRLTTLPLEQLKPDPLTAGKAFAQEYGVTVVLKGAHTLTAAPGERVWINTTGNAGLAKAGSGDVLAGLVGALAAQGRSPEEAAACGVWLHGMAGDYAAGEFSQYAMLARDVIDALPRVFADNDR